MFGTATRDDWKQKYRDLLSEIESNEHDARALSDALRGVATRLAIAAMGRDPVVDGHLDDMISAIKRRAGEAELNALLETLAAAVVATEKESTVNAAIDLSRFVASLPLDATDQRRHIDALEADTVSARSTALSNLAQELTQRLGDTGDDRNLSVAVERLLERCAAVPSLAAAGRDIKKQLAESGDVDQALSQLFGVIVQTVQTLHQEKTELEVFLEEVTRQLAQFESWTDYQQADAQARAQDSQSLGADMDLHVGALHAEIDTSTDLQEFKSRVRGRLDNIAGRLTRFREQETRRAELANERHNSLREEVNRLRTRTTELAARCAEQETTLMHDVLTGVHTRYAYEQRLQEEFQRWQRHGMPLSFSIWDLDFFKKVNDRYGHQAGDRLLSAVGALLNHHTRAEDFVARIGGEEFVILFPATAVEGALVRCERLREQLAGASFRCKDDPLDVTMSCGVTQFVDGDTPQVVYERADGALYTAKQQGRNRCVRT